MRPNELIYEKKYEMTENGVKITQKYISFHRAEASSPDELGRKLAEDYRNIAYDPGMYPNKEGKEVQIIAGDAVVFRRGLDDAELEAVTNQLFAKLHSK